MEMNDVHKLSDTMYSQPDATKLYHKMDELEKNTKLIQQIKDFEIKYATQSRQFMQLKLENQSLKNANLRLKKDALDFADKLKATNNTKHKLLEELQTSKQLKKQCNAYQKELKKKNTDIQRLKSAMWNLNKFICSNNQTNINEPGSDGDKVGNMAMVNQNAENKLMSLNNVTSLSFEHDLDLEENVEIESTKSNIVVNKKKYKNKALRQKYKTSSSRSSSASTSSPDLLQEITKVIANQQRSRNSMGTKANQKKVSTKRIKQAKKIKNAKSKRSFIPKPSSNDLNSSSRSRRIALNKKKTANINTKSTSRSTDNSAVKLASV